MTTGNARRDDGRRRGRIARASLLLALLGSVLLYLNADQPDFDPDALAARGNGGRLLQATTSAASAEPDDAPAETESTTTKTTTTTDTASGTTVDRTRLHRRKLGRKLAKNGASPPAEEEIAGEYIIKPWVGYAALDVYENINQCKLTLGNPLSSSNEAAQYESHESTRLTPVSATASTSNGPSPASMAIDGDPGTAWSSCINNCEGTSTLTVQLNGAQNLREVFVDWEAAYAVDFQIRVGNSAAGPWTVVHATTGKSNDADSYIDLTNVAAAQGVSYVQLLMTRKRDGYTNFSVYRLHLYRQYLVTSSYGPEKAIDNSLSTRWSSSIAGGGGDEWLEVDMGGPQLLQSVVIDWEQAYAVDYQIQVSPDRSTWTTLHSENGKGSNAQTSVNVDGVPGSMGNRYLRVYCTRRVTGFNNFSIHLVRIMRKPMVVGENPTGLFCGATISAVSSYLLGTYGGTLIHTYENAEFFSASLSPAQSEAMFNDNCVFTVETNYRVRARGRTTKRLGHRGANARLDEAVEVDREQRRRLAIPEFNLKETNPASWGLERISSRGRRNGAYMWLHEGLDTHIYIFDTGIYPDHSDWQGRNGTRYGDGLICAGQADDYTQSDHGTYIASIAAGWTFGTARSAIFHPIQVLDGNGEGSTASLLCGMEKLLQDGKDYNAANYPKKIRSLVNLSLGVNGRSDALDKAVKDMTDVGYTVVIAAGDSNGNACFFSPYDPTAITVGALSDVPNGANTKTATSNYGECIDVWAPGENIAGASNAGEYESVVKSGTSVAAAFVTGASSLFFDEINTEIYPDPGAFTARVKDKILRKAEKDVLVNIGIGSVNKIIQTTASACQHDWHCDYGLTCLMDGICGDLSDYF